MVYRYARSTPYHSILWVYTYLGVELLDDMKIVFFFYFNKREGPGEEQSERNKQTSPWVGRQMGAPSLDPEITTWAEAKSDA